MEVLTMFLPFISMVVAGVVSSIIYIGLDKVKTFLLNLEKPIFRAISFIVFILAVVLFLGIGILINWIVYKWTEIPLDEYLWTRMLGFVLGAIGVFITWLIVALRRKPVKY